MKKQNLAALSVAAVLALGLTACNSDGNGMPGGAGSAAQTRSRNSGAGVGRVTAVVPYDNSVASRRTAYDYLQDGHYQANGDGWVAGSAGAAARDLTRDAREIVRNAGRDLERMGE